MEYKRLLITGFDPFGGERLNSSWEALYLEAQRMRSFVRRIHLSLM